MRLFCLASILLSVSGCGGDDCTASTACTPGSVAHYQFCNSGKADDCYYLTGDGMKLHCVTCGDCSDAQSEVTDWCQTQPDKPTTGGTTGSLSGTCTTATCPDGNTTYEFCAAATGTGCRLPRLRRQGVRVQLVQRLHQRRPTDRHLVPGRRHDDHDHHHQRQRRRLQDEQRLPDLLRRSSRHRGDRLSQPLPRLCLPAVLVAVRRREPVRVEHLRVHPVPQHRRAGHLPAGAVDRLRQQRRLRRVRAVRRTVHHVDALRRRGRRGCTGSSTARAKTHQREAELLGQIHRQRRGRADRGDQR